MPFVGELPIASQPKRLAMKVVSASSFERGEGEPANAVDGDPGTFWHTRWSGPELPTPALAHPRPRRPDEDRRSGPPAARTQATAASATTKSSSAPTAETWGDPVAKGRLRDNEEPQTITLKTSAAGRYLKFVALSESQSRAWTTLAELDVVPVK